MVVFTGSGLRVLVAKNGRAREYIDGTVELEGCSVQDMRGEDIPWLVDRELPQYFGLTTTEIVADYLLGAVNSQLEVVRVISWEDDVLRYGKPAVCAVGSSETTKDGLQSIRERDIVVVVNGKFPLLGAALAAGYIDRKSMAFKRMSGETEAALKSGMADMVVEIVGTGRTVERYGLQICAPLFFVDLAVVSNKNYLRQLKQGG